MLTFPGPVSESDQENTLFIPGFTISLYGLKSKESR